MAGMSTSPIITATKDVKGLRRTHSGRDLCDRAGLRRSYSDNHLCYSINRIRAASSPPKLKSSPSIGLFPFRLSSSIIPNSLRSFLLDPETSKEMQLVESEEPEVAQQEKRANWVERIMEIGSHWRNGLKIENIESGNGDGDEDEGGCEVDYGSEEEEGRVSFDSDLFSKFLVEVPWSDTRDFSRLAFLCNLAYVIPQIKAKDLRKYCALRFVTSSLEKKAEAAAIKAKLEQDSTRVPLAALEATGSNSGEILCLENKRPLRPVAYEIAASAASYVQCRAKNLLSLGSEPRRESGNEVPCRIEDHAREEGGGSPSRACKSEVAAYVAASTMTAVVAAGETEKQEAAKNLRSLHSSPCEWFICDDLSTYTRCFIIQGSDSLASWQANLFFEPAKFEETEVHVHRGIYEAAKGIYEQFMPEIMEHLNRYGERAKLQFTGHSLGGSLSLMVNLMLLARNVVKPSTLLPVVMFGSPFVFCGGQKILEELGLDESRVHCVMMHRDIVPRAFSCNYPNQVAQVLKRLNGTFRSHPCLNKNKLLYSPLGKIFILQPDEHSSPPHPLLPPGNALYALGKTQCGCPASALRAFLNSPHPLETLSDPTAYGSDGTILRDHDSSNYLKAVNGALRQYSKVVVRRAREERNLIWPLLTSPSPHAWNHEGHLEKSCLVTKEIMTGV